MKYTRGHYKVKRPRKRPQFSDKKVFKLILFFLSISVAVWVVLYSNLLKIQSTDFNSPADLTCLDTQDLQKYDQTGKSIFFFDTTKLESEIKKNPCLEEVFVELTPSRSLKISLIQATPTANLFINPKLSQARLIATSSVELKNASVSALIETSSLIDTSKDLNTKSLIQPRSASVSALPKFVISDDDKKTTDFASLRINEVFQCLSQNLIQTTSVINLNPDLQIYYITVSNGFAVFNTKLLISPSAISEKFCLALQEIIQKSTIDGIKLDSIDLRFKDPVVNLKK